MMCGHTSRIDHDEYDNLAVLCGTCDGEGSLLCWQCSGSGEGMRDGALCGACRGQGELPCPDCTPQCENDDNDEDATGKLYRAFARR